MKFIKEERLFRNFFVSMFLCTIITLLPLILLWNIRGYALQASTLTDWGDNFDDSNYEGWTVLHGAFDASNGTLEASGGISFSWGEVFNLIQHPSQVAYGTWSFDIQIIKSSFLIAEGLTVFFSMETLGEPIRPLIQTQAEGYLLSIGTDPSGGGPETDSPGVGLFYVSAETGGVALGGSSGSCFLYPDGFPSTFHIDITRGLDGHFNIFLDGTLIIEAMDATMEISNEFGFESPDGYSLDNVFIDDNITIRPVPSERAVVNCLEESLDLSCKPGSTASESITLQNTGQATGYAKISITPILSGFTPLIVGKEIRSLMKDATEEMEIGIKTDTSVNPGNYEFTAEFWNSSTLLDTLEMNLTVMEDTTTTTDVAGFSLDLLVIGMVVSFVLVILIRRHQ